MEISRKNSKLRLSLWLAFVAVSLLTFCTRYYALFYIVPQVKFSLLAALGFFCLILAILILVFEGLRLWVVAGVLLGLIVGQLWFIELAAMLLFWHFRGFAP